MASIYFLDFLDLTELKLNRRGSSKDQNSNLNAALLIIYFFNNTIQSWKLVYGGQDFSLWGIVEGLIAKLIA